MPVLPDVACGDEGLDMAAESQPFMMDLLSEQQIKAWCDGRIENLRFDPDDGMLSYRITSEPGSRISFKVPEQRVAEWHKVSGR